MQLERKIHKDVTGLGERIRQARIADKRSLPKLAELAGISHTYWREVGAGTGKNLQEHTLAGIEKALGVNFGLTLPTSKAEGFLPT